MKINNNILTKGCIAMMKNLNKKAELLLGFFILVKFKPSHPKVVEHGLVAVHYLL
jgi:hypothetical protein